ncbi:helix-turn-helix domain-containing protein [Paenibacillus mucilaginosus]|uniref:helix-turn-helix domain-containing protein n=1 Tax=Paenibacillus mucilaginosus TaxID=61624 RepID=UPI00236803AE|nr:LysR family transcriptional regulator [Paenibacillus mucilaginosus]
MNRGCPHVDIRQLAYLLEIAKHQNITKAAEALHMTQPTLSKIVKAVEEELGVTLFDRSGKSVRRHRCGRSRRRSDSLCPAGVRGASHGARRRRAAEKGPDSHRPAARDRLRVLPPDSGRVPRQASAY